MAQVRAELGYVDFLRARYDRSQVWLADSLDLAAGSDRIMAKASTYLGSVESDRGDYPAALRHLDAACRLSRRAGDVRRESFALSMLGRLHLLRGRLDDAAACLDESIALAERDRWLAVLPWPQALRGEVELARGDAAAAASMLEHSFARACQLGDPCWEGMAARGLALVAESSGDVAGAFDLLADARTRCNRLADPYVWLDAYILDALCDLGRRHGHPETMRWIDALRTLASRTSMREMTVRAMLHGAALGIEGDLQVAVLLAAGIDSAALASLIDDAAGRAASSD
jgi:tetratricopeptide (TPR) repeat protein